MIKKSLCHIIGVALLGVSMLPAIVYSYGDAKSNAEKIELNKEVVDQYSFTPTFDKDNNYIHDKKTGYYYFNTSDRESDYRLEGQIIGKHNDERNISNIDGYDEFPGEDLPYAFLGVSGEKLHVIVSNNYLRSYRIYRLERNKKYYIKVDFESDIEKEKLKLCVKEIIHKPGKTKIMSLKGGKRKLTVNYSKSKYARKYQVSIKKKGSKKWSKPYTTTKRTLTIKKLKCKRKYYVRVRGYLNNAGTVYKSKWSRAKIVKTK